MLLYHVLRRCLLASSLLLSIAWAQAPFSFLDSIPVWKEGRDLKSAWCGGIHAPQFSSIDLDGDPFPDLFVYEQAGRHVLTFRNLGLADSAAFSFDRSLSLRFPKKLGLWTLLADFDCDGRKDLFTRENGPIAAYRNNGNGFTKMGFPLFSDDGGNLAAIFARTGSLPAIADLDGDGDLDILVLSPDGSLIWMHQNESQERYGHCDSLEFSLADACWGKYSDGSLTTQPQLGISCRRIPAAYQPFEALPHPSGTTLTALDLDGDGDKEVLHANYPAPNTFMLRNAGSPAAASMDSVQLYFPDYDQPIDMQVYPASFFEDVDNDGARDLLVAPFVVQQDQDNLQQSWFYKNTGTDAAPIFQREATDFLVADMIDVGAKAHPLLLDIDADGDLDLLIGNFGTGDTARLSLYRNAGSQTAPAFEWETNDYSGVSGLGLKDVVPCAGDLDGDGDADLVLGEQNGRFYFLENEPLVNGEAQFNLPGQPISDLDAGSNAQPFLHDVDGDQDLDLLVGRLDGQISLFENQGSISSFLFQDTNEQVGWGGIDVQPQCCVGNAAPFIADFQGQSRLFVANDLGQIWNYSLGSSPILLDSFVVGGRFLSITGGDLDGDGDIELLLGNGAGGLQIIDFDQLVEVQEVKEARENSLELYPNPATSKLTFQMESKTERGAWRIASAVGREIMHGNFHGGGAEIDVTDIPSGAYFLLVATDSGYESARLFFTTK